MAIKFNIIRTLLGLDDTPDNYIGQAGKVLKVNTSEDALEFGDTSSGGIASTVEVVQNLAKTADWATDVAAAAYGINENQDLIVIYDNSEVYRCVVSNKPKSNLTDADFVKLPSGSAGASTFLTLTDTPTAYTGNANKIPAVNAGETGLEFIDPPSGGASDFISLSDTPTAYTGQAGKIPIVNTAGNALEFKAIPPPELPIYSTLKVEKLQITNGVNFITNYRDYSLDNIVELWASDLKTSLFSTGSNNYQGLKIGNDYFVLGWIGAQYLESSYPQYPSAANIYKKNALTGIYDEVDTTKPIVDDDPYFSFAVSVESNNINVFAATLIDDYNVRAYVNVGLTYNGNLIYEASDPFTTSSEDTDLVMDVIPINPDTILLHYTKSTQNRIYAFGVWRRTANDWSSYKSLDVDITGADQWIFLNNTDTLVILGGKVKILDLSGASIVETHSFDNAYARFVGKLDVEQNILNGELLVYGKRVPSSTGELDSYSVLYSTSGITPPATVYDFSKPTSGIIIDDDKVDYSNYLLMPLSKNMKKSLIVDSNELYVTKQLVSPVPLSTRPNELDAVNYSSDVQQSLEITERENKFNLAAPTNITFFGYNLKTAGEYIFKVDSFMPAIKQNLTK